MDPSSLTKFILTDIMVGRYYYIIEYLSDSHYINLQEKSFYHVIDVHEHNVIVAFCTANFSACRNFLH